MAQTQVRGVQIKDDDITSNDIADAAVRGATANGGTQREIATGTVSDVDIRNSAITPLKIDSTQNFTMNKLTLSATTQQLVLGTTNTTTLTFTAPAASRTYTIPETGANSSFVMTDGNQTLTGNETFSGILFLANGSASAPSLALTNSTTTGFYRVGTDILGITTAGVVSVQVDASHHLDFLQHQAKQLVVHLLASDPVSPVEGQIWYNTTTKQWSGYNGTINVLLG